MERAMINIARLNPFARITGSEIVGIELGAGFLKLVHFKSSLQKSEILNILSKEITNLSDDDVAKAIKALFAELKAKDPRVVSIIPAQLAITKNIEIPSCDPAEIREIISLQAGRHTPYSREEIIVDYVDLGAFKNSYTKILLVIVARNIVKRHCETLSKAGLKLEKVLFAPEGLALSASRALKLGSENIPVSLVNIDDVSSDFAVIFRSKPLFVRSISIGFQHLSQEHKEVYNKKFIEELKKSLEAYQAEGLEKPPNILLVCGACEELSGLEALLSDNLRLPVKSASYLRNVPLSADILKRPFAKNISFLNLISCQLAYDGLKIDLTLEEIKLRKAIEERGRELVKTGAFVLANFVLIFLILTGRIYFKALRLKELNARYLPLGQEAKELENKYSKISLIRNSLLNRGYSLEALVELYNVLPKKAYITDIRMDEQGRFSLSGSAESMSVVFAFVDNIEKSRYFKDVKTKHATNRKEGAGEVADFEIAAAVDKDAG